MKAFVSMAAVLAVGLASGVTGTRAQTPPAGQAQTAAQAPGYAWADACKKCHEPIYEAWARTKHAKALERLSSGEQDGECIGCHVTGPKARVLDGRKVLNAGVQCESCHGGAAAHAADPTVRTGLIRKPSAESCQECHSEKSPHFKGFFFGAMVGVVHHVR